MATRFPRSTLWVKGKPVARLPFETIGEGLTAYPFLEIFPQDQHERLLIERLEAFGVSVERQTELLRFDAEDDRVTAHLRGPGGREEGCRKLVSRRLHPKNSAKSRTTSMK